MALMTWSGALSVGVESMDEQHRGLLQSLNDLHDAMAKGQSQRIMAKLLQSLLKYTREHFAAEEVLLMRSRYPKVEEHRKLHRELTGRVQEYVRSFHADEVVSVDLMNFLRDWLTKHIQQEDRLYGEWLQEHGVR